VKFILYLLGALVLLRLFQNSQVVVTAPAVGAPGAIAPPTQCRCLQSTLITSSGFQPAPTGCGCSSPWTPQPFPGFGGPLNYFPTKVTIPESANPQMVTPDMSGTTTFAAAYGGG
jgi:hypothetical protein